MAMVRFNASAKVENPGMPAGDGNFFKIFAFMLRAPLFLLFAVLAAASCVRPAVYRAELSARSASEAREATLRQELARRSEEQAGLIGEIGEISRSLGEKQEKINRLEQEIAIQSQQYGASHSKMATEMDAMQQEIERLSKLLAGRTDTLERLRRAETNRQQMLARLVDTLQLAFARDSALGIAVTRDAATVTVVFPDRPLFENNAVGIGAAGRALLAPVAEVLGRYPTLDAEIVGHTDTNLPRPLRQMDDTWEWSLQRATNVVRQLIREYNVNPNQLTPIGRGEFYPVQSNETPEGRRKNRRTEIVLRPAVPPGGGP
jgi:chemotaxis protein MotB